jgi:hypothetical protein
MSATFGESFTQSGTARTRGPHGPHDLAERDRIGSEDASPFRPVRARRVQLERDDAGRAVEPRRALGELVRAVAPEVGDDARAPLAEEREPIAEEGLDADVLEADRVQHAARRLDEPRRRLSRRRAKREALHRDRADGRDVHEARELRPVAERPGRGDHRVRQLDRADRDAAVDVGAAHRPSSRSSITIASWPGRSSRGGRRGP